VDPVDEAPSTQPAETGTVEVLDATSEVAAPVEPADSGEQTEPAEVAALAEAKPAPPSLSPSECAQALKARFPALFAGAPKPLKLRIQADIQARAPGEFSRQSLSGFLRRYTGSTGYLMALARAPHRLDLDGQATDPISEEHRKAAQEELARRRQLNEARRAEEVAEQEDQLQRRRNRATLLRDFERTTLTEANFSALKGLSVEELHSILERARADAAEAPPAPAARPASSDRAGDERPRGSFRGATGEPRAAGPRPPREPQGARAPHGNAPGPRRR
jgi:sRNA-binding protein